MVEDNLEINQKVDVEVESGSYQGKYLCKVAEINTDEFKITPPYCRGELVPLRRDRPVTIYFTGDDAAYMFKTTVVDRVSEPIPLLTLKIPDKISRIQRREFFRIEVKQKVTYNLLDAEWEPVGVSRETTISDLSGGGLKISVDEDLRKEALLELYLDLPGLEETAIIGKIVNNYKRDDNKFVGIEFIEINNLAREKIISWLFDYQRELRQRGLL